MQRRIAFPQQIKYPQMKLQPPIAQFPIQMPQQQQQAQLKYIDRFMYDTTQCLGKGSYSEVYKGKENGTGKPVAIKMMHLQNLKNNFVHQLVLSEITIMKSFKHQNIVELYEVIQSHNNLYIILEYCNQGDLRQLLKKKKKLSEDQAVHILFEVVQGYKDILNHNIIHRDIKPENILIHNGICKIADFGFAQAISNRNQQLISVPVGTPLYCSPQCMAETYYTVKTDLWSLGIIFYEMLYGQTPWPCQNYEDLKHQMKVHPYIRYPNNSAISEDAYEFIKNSLQFEESKRMSWEDAMKSNHEKIENINILVEKKPVQKEEHFQYQQMLLEQYKQTKGGSKQMSGHISPNCNATYQQQMEKQKDRRPESSGERPTKQKKEKEQINLTLNLAPTLSQTLDPVKIPHNIEISDDFHQNNEIILFNLNYINTLNLIKNLTDATTFLPLNLSQPKLQFILLKHLVIKILPLKNIPQEPEQNFLNLKNAGTYINSETFQIHYKTISNYANQFEMWYDALSETLKPIEPQLIKDTVFIDLYQLPLNDSQTFYAHLGQFLAHLIRQLNHSINLELQAMFNQKQFELGSDLQLITKNQENLILLLAFLIKYYKIVQVNNTNFNDILALSNEVNFSQILVEANVNVDVDYYVNLRKIIYELDI